MALSFKIWNEMRTTPIRRQYKATRLTLDNFSPSWCGSNVLNDWNPALMLCIRRRSLLLAISRRIRFSCSMWLRDATRPRLLISLLLLNATFWLATRRPAPTLPFDCDSCCRCCGCRSWVSATSATVTLVVTESSSTVSTLLQTNE